MTKKPNSSDSSEEKRVFDVSKPGDTAAGPNSRPVIVRRSMIKKDPMFSGDGEKTKVEAEDEEKPGKAEPLAVSVKDVPDPEAKQENAEEKTDKKGKKEEQEKQPDIAPDDQADEEKPPAEKPAEAKAEASDQPKPETEAPQDDTSAEGEPKGSDAATVETLAGDAKTAREVKNQSKENEEAAKERQKLVDSKQYFLNIGEAKRRKTGARVLTVLIILLILVAVAYLLALDAEIIEGSIEPLTDIL